MFILQHTLQYISVDRSHACIKPLSIKTIFISNVEYLEMPTQSEIGKFFKVVTNKEYMKQ